MDEYVSRQDVIATIRENGVYGSGYSNEEREDDVVDMIESVPAADVRTVVLCKDCRYRDPEDYKCDSGQLERAGCIFPVDDDYFCAYGEKKDET